MVYHTIQAWLRKAFPRFVSETIRSLATAILTPVHFSVRTGHFRSSLRCRAADSEGNSIPWYTYPMIDFLKHKEYTGRAVLEFGAGQSTHWWAHARRKSFRSRPIKCGMRRYADIPPTPLFTISQTIFPDSERSATRALILSSWMAWTGVAAEKHCDT